MRFVHDTLPQRVSFGSGEAWATAATKISDELGVLLSTHGANVRH